MNIDNIKDKYENPKTFANVKSLLKRINVSLELKPYEYVHEHMYVTNFDDLYRKLFADGMAKTHKDALYKLTTLLGIIKRFDVTKAQGLLDKLSELKSSELPEIKIEEQEPAFRPWSEMLEIFDEQINTNPNRNAKIACVCFKHGYCLPIGDIYNTTTKLGRPGMSFNHLDLDNLVWTVTEHRNAHLGRRVFQVTQAFADEIRKYIELPDYLLMYKSTFEPYTTHLLSSIGIDRFTNDEVRNSYNYWNWTASARTKQESTEYATEVLGYTLTTATKYAKKYEQQEPPVLQGCDPHPLYLENPERYTVSGKIRITVKVRPRSPSVESC